MRPLLVSCLFIMALVVSPLSKASPSELYPLTFDSLNEEQVQLGTYRNKVLLINFWATWCPPCVKELPSMERLRQHFSDQAFEIIAINTGEPADKVIKFKNQLETPLTFPILLDKKGRSFKEFGLRGLPMSYLFDKQGNLLETIAGEQDWDSDASISLIESALAR